MNQYLSLKEGCYLVKGPKRGAVYDLKNKAIYSVEERIAHLISRCLEGIPYKQVLRRITSKEEKDDYFIDKAVKSLPFVKFDNKPYPVSSISDILLKGGNEKSAWLEPTNKCNLRCIHCYADSRNPLEEELSLTEWYRVIDQLFSLGFRYFTIAGGEPFVFLNILSFLKYLITKGAKSLLIITNGTLLSNKILGFFVANKIKLNITFYSHLPEHHEKITGVRGSWKKTVEGIKRVVKMGIPYTINIPLGAYNQNDLEKTLDFLESLGVERKQTHGSIVFPLGRGCDRSVLPDVYTIFSIKKPVYQLFTTPEERLIYRTCWSGKLLIKPNGDITPCPCARDRRFIMGNARTNPLEKILSDKRLHFLWNITLDDIEECRECEFRYGCPDCRAMAFIYSRNLFAKNPYCFYDPTKGIWKEIQDRDIKFKELSLVRNKGFKTWSKESTLGIFHEETGAFYVLNKLGTEIYNLLDGKHSFEDIIRYLIAHYEVDEETLRKDVATILKKFRDLDIIQ